MVLETEAVAAPETEIAPAPGGFGAEDTPPETPAEGETPSEEAPPPEAPQFENIEDFYKYLEDKEDLKAAHESHLDELKREARKTGLSEAQARLQPMVQQYREMSGTAAQGLQTINNTLQKLVRDGMVDGNEIAAALQSNPAAWEAWNGLGHVAGTFDGAKNMVRLIAGDNEKLAQEYLQRIDAVQGGADTAPAVAADLVDAIMDERLERAKKPLQTEIAKLKAALAEAKGEAGAGQGPNTSTGKSASGAITEESISAMSSEEYDRRRPEILKWQADQFRR